MRLFFDRDFATFQASTSKQRHTPIEKYLFEWVLSASSLCLARGWELANGTVR